jgi:hypothetical protein
MSKLRFLRGRPHALVAFFALLALAGLAACQPPKPPPKEPPPADPCAPAQVEIDAEECGWAFRAADINGEVTQSTGDFVTGPETPPVGPGSLRLTVGPDIDASHDAMEFRNVNFVGTKLADLTELTYSTYVDHPDDHSGQAAFLTLRIDKDGNGTGDETMFFEPVYQTGGYGTVDPSVSVPNQCSGMENPCAVVGEWQTWDALAGGWWINTGGPPLDTIAHYVSVNPNATIVNNDDGLGGVRIAAGYGSPPWPNFVGNVDALKINGKTFNFET